MKKELTLRAVIIGLFLSMLMGAANVYLGLKVGMTVSASIPAAVLGVLILRAFFRDSSMLEANQIQTAASAGESLAAGVIFTLPALVLVGAWQHFDWKITTLIAMGGGLLGILFMIPMRKVFIIDNNDLVFPEGVACAEVLRATEHKNRPKDALAILWGSIIGGLFKLAAGFVGLIHHSVETAWRFNSSKVLYVGADISPALLGVGFIVKWRIALLVFLGGAFGWLLCIPMIGLADPTKASAVDQAWSLWDGQIRYIGVGAMLVAGIDSIVHVRKGLKSAFLHTKERFLGNGRSVEDEDISSRVISVFLILVLVAALIVYFNFTGNVAVTLLATLLMFVMSFFFTAVASYIVGLVGSSNSPVSGMTITAVLISGTFILLTSTFTGIEGLGAMSAMLGIAGIVCCVACTSGDICNDLKTGHLVGASPRLQQRMQIGGVIVGSLVMAPVLELLHQNTEGGIGGRLLAAPQATLFANLAQGFFSDKQLPWDMVAIGIAVGIIVLVLDLFLKKRNFSLPLHLMPIAVGIYLPFGVTIPMLAGAFLAHSAERHSSSDDRAHEGVLLCSGMIAGEALMGILIALLSAFSVTKLQIFPEDSPWITAFTILLSFATVFGVWRWLIRANRPSKDIT